MQVKVYAAQDLPHTTAHRVFHADIIKPDHRDQPATIERAERRNCNSATSVMTAEQAAM